MTQPTRGPRTHERWAHLRFSVVGQLLAAPPTKGDLHAEIEALAARQWRHPTTGEPVRFGFSTIERWYYRALRERADPVSVLRRKRRADAGQQMAMCDAVRHAVLAQYAAHKGWSIQLHHDNLVALATTRPDLQPVPAYATLRRFMQANGLNKRRRWTVRPRRQLRALFGSDLRRNRDGSGVDPWGYPRHGQARSQTVASLPLTLAPDAGPHDKPRDKSRGSGAN